LIKFSIGQSAARIEDQRLLTGSGRYTDDSVDPAAARAYILRSDRAHADIAITSTSAAAGAPGVIAVLTEKDLAADNIGDLPCLTELDNRDGSKQHYTEWPALARDRVRFVGQPVAIVIAQTAAQARDAAELIDIDYTDLPVSLDTEATTADGATQLWPEMKNNIAFDWHIGDEAAVDELFEQSSHITRLRLENNRVVVNSMEPRPIYAEYDKGSDRTTLHSSTQGPSFILGPLATQVLKIDAAKIRCVTGDVGGGFGMKVFLYAEHVLVTWASRKLGINISYLPTRSDAFTSDVHGRDLVSHVEAATDADGVIQALRVTTYSNMGAYLSNFGPYIQTGSGGHMIPGCYRMPQCYNRVIGVMTNTVPVDAYRGAGRPEATYLIERLMDVIADDHNLAPDEIRRRNFIRPEQMPYTTPLGNTYDSGDFQAVMDTAMKKANWQGFEQRKQQSENNGKLRGIGMAVYIERCGGGGGMPSRIEFNDDDTLTLLSGSQTNGQGHETAFTQILSDRLGIPIEQIKFVQGDTDRTPAGFTGGSRSIPIGGSSTIVAADTIIEKGRKIASHVMETAEADIEFAEGSFTVAGTDMKMDLFSVARAARDEAKLPAGVEPGLDTEQEFTSEEATYPNGCHICEIEIDPDTGVLDIAQYLVVDDFGDVVNPNLLEGQVHGGIAQGLGQALLEHTVYDEGGQLVSGSFMDYTMPRADNIPHVDFTTQNIPCKNNLLGIKGAGEAGAIGSPPAAINAVVNALRSRTGLNHVDMPATTQKIWNLLHSPT
jgi:carbon-monoxide dehydrogenase large subunit